MNKDHIIRTDSLSRVNDDTDISKKYFDLDVNGKDEFPIAISSNYSNERILRQRGCFTIHGTNNSSIEKFYVKNHCKDIVQIIIDKKRRNNILNELEIAGISESSIFPDLDGLAREIKKKYTQKI